VIAVGWWQALLNGMGWVLAHIYDGVHNYGVAIILLTLGIRLLLLPLGLKQIRSMQAMQAIQPQIKQLQQKYKGNKQKLNEEMMRLYKERGVNPLAGCLPMLLQIPVLIALYSVLRFPQHPAHFPADSALQRRINIAVSVQHPTNPSSFLGMNLLCNAQQAGKTVEVTDATTKPPKVVGKLDCGSGGVPNRIPYYVLGLLMVGTMYYQQRQMQRAAPPGANAQQQALGRILPLISIFWGFIVPSGVILYWTTSNLVQIGQQHFLLRAGHIREPILGHERAGDGKAEAGAGGGRPVPAKRTRPAPTASARRGFFASMLERAETERAKRQSQDGGAGSSGSGSSGSSGRTAPPSSSGGGSSSGQQQARRPSSGGGGNARSRKKRRKR
jgi:YidC/Oxa1 family membrane protein insertase